MIKRRSLLILNILIGCAVIWLIYQFNQLVPGGSYYKKITRIEAAKWSIVIGADEVQAMLDAKATCLSRGLQCAEAEKLEASILLASAPDWKVLRDPTKMSWERRAKMLEVANRYWLNAQEAARFCVSARTIDQHYVERSILLRKIDRSLLSEFLGVLDAASLDEREAAARMVKSTQFVFILVLVAVWAFSALFTDAFVLRPARRSADPTRYQI